MKRSDYRLLIGLVLLVCVITAISGTLSDRWALTLTSAALYAVLGAAWNIQAGYAGVLGLGNAAFVAIGAYTSIALYNHFGLSPWIGMWVGAALSVIFGVVTAAVALRAGLRGISFALATFASAQIVYFWVLDRRWLGGAGGIRLEDISADALNFRFTSHGEYLIIATILLALTLATTGYLRSRKLGLYMRAVRENERAAAMSGVHVLRYQLISVALSAGFSSLAGTLYAQWQLSVSPSAVLGLPMAVNTIIFTVIGGTGFLFGPLIGAVTLVSVSELATHLTSRAADFATIRMIIYGGAIALAAVFMPGGIASLFGRARSGRVGSDRRLRSPRHTQEDSSASVREEVPS